MRQEQKNTAVKGEFDLAWDDGHVVPPVMYPDLAFLFRRMNDVTVNEVGTGEGDRILDIGCGRAIDTARLAERRGDCVGLEPSEAMVYHAREHVENSGSRVELVRGVGEQLPFKDSSFDKVVCKGALDHFPDPFEAVREMARVLKPEGTVIITIANFESLGFRLGRRFVRLISVFDNDGADKKRVWHVPHDHVYRFDYAFLKQLVEPHLEVDRAIGISLLFGFPWWGWFLNKLPTPVSSATLSTMDRVARHFPSLGDTILVKCHTRDGTPAQRQH